MPVLRHVSSAAAFFILGACAPGSPPATPAPMMVDTVYVMDTVQVAAAGDAALGQEVALLQFQLLDRDAQLAAMQEQLDAARQEVVRTMAKVQGQASRAEAASGMAEAELDLQTLAGLPGGRSLPEYAEGARLLAESGEEFNGDNYAGALYLATQVRTRAQAAQSRLRGSASEELRAGETLFALPIPLEAARTSNVRSGPGLNFAVQFSLQPGEAVWGRSYTSQWVHIVDEQGREGWVFHALVGSRDRP